MAHNLKLSVVAEGVETEQQLEFLRVRACDEIQGYLFSRPVPAPMFSQLLQGVSKFAFLSNYSLPSAVSSCE